MQRTKKACFCELFEVLEKSFWRPGPRNPCQDQESWHQTQQGQPSTSATHPRPRWCQDEWVVGEVCQDTRIKAGSIDAWLGGERTMTVHTTRTKGPPALSTGPGRGPTSSSALGTAETHTADATCANCTRLSNRLCFVPTPANQRPLVLLERCKLLALVLFCQPLNDSSSH